MPFAKMFHTLIIVIDFYTYGTEIKINDIKNKHHKYFLKLCNQNYIKKNDMINDVYKNKS